MLKVLLRIAQNIRRSYWWLVRPTTRGVRAIVVDQEGSILLVKHKYQDGWFLPGGKVKKKETDTDALKRELKEEVGVENIDEMTKLGEYENTYEHKKDTIVVYVITSFSQKEKKHFELEEYKFFKPSGLPETTSPGTRRRIKEWFNHKTPTEKW